MAKIIRLRSRHQDTLALLPWYMTGQLDAAESAQVAQHLRRCAACRAELDTERRLLEAVATLPLDAEQGWTRLQRRLATPERSRWAGGLRRAAKPALAAAAAALIVAVGLALPHSPPAAYHALGGARPAAGGDLVIGFRPDTRERALRAILQANDARLVDGPTAADAYVIRVPVNARTATLARLRARPEVLFVAALDSATPP